MQPAPLADKAGPTEGDFPVSVNGSTETMLATLASGAMAILVTYMHVRGYGYWLAGIALLYALSLRLSLSIHALGYRGGIFRGRPLVGGPIEFRAASIANLVSDDRSRPPRARIELKDGRRILIKKPLWMVPVTAAEFEAKIKARMESAAG
jgi:hypothetical protein